jgi:predicted secreted protein
MAIVHGKDGRVLIGASTMGSTVSWSLDISGETADKSAQGDTWKSHLAGLSGWSGTVEAHFDDDDAAQSAAAILSSATMHFYPEGTGTPKPDWNGTATITGINYSTPIGDVVKVSFNFEGDGALDLASTQ